MWYFLVEPAHAGRSSFLRKPPLGAETTAALPEYSSDFELCSNLFLQTAFSVSSIHVEGIGGSLMVKTLCPQH